MAEGAIWADAEKARQVVQEVKELKRWLDPYRALRKRLDDAQGLSELAEIDEDDELEPELGTEAEQIGAQLEALELQNMLRSPDDARDALLTIHPGAGGTESQDWAEMLMRMYTRWGERKGMKVDLVDHHSGEQAGIKSATILVRVDRRNGVVRAPFGGKDMELRLAG